MLNIATDGWSILLLLLLLALGSWVDLRAHRIPNAIVLSGVLLAFALHGLDGGPRGLGATLAGMLVAGGLLLPFHLGGGMGAGDVKLMAMVGAFLGPVGVLPAVAMTLVAGALLGVAVPLAAQAVHARFGLRLLASTQAEMPPRWRPESVEPGRARTLRFPYAVAIVAGTLGSLWFFADLKPAGELVATLWTR